VKLFLGLQLVKWVLEVLKELQYKMAAEDCSKVAIEDLKKKFM
jgi:hypothetical protein